MGDEDQDRHGTDRKRRKEDKQGHKKNVSRNLTSSCGRKNTTRRHHKHHREKSATLRGISKSGIVQKERDRDPKKSKDRDRIKSRPKKEELIGEDPLLMKRRLQPDVDIRSSSGSAKRTISRSLSNEKISTTKLTLAKQSQLNTEITRVFGKNMDKFFDCDLLQRYKKSGTLLSGNASKDKIDKPTLHTIETETTDSAKFGRLRKMRKLVGSVGEIVHSKKEDEESEIQMEVLRERYREEMCRAFKVNLAVLGKELNDCLRKNSGGIEPPTSARRRKHSRSVSLGAINMDVVKKEAASIPSEPIKRELSNVQLLLDIFGEEKVLLLWTLLHTEVFDLSVKRLKLSQFLQRRPSITDMEDSGILGGKKPMLRPTDEKAASFIDKSREPADLGLQPVFVSPLFSKPSPDDIISLKPNFIVECGVEIPEEAKKTFFSEEYLVLVRCEDSVPFYSKFFSNIEHVHFVGFDAKGPTIVSIETTTTKGKGEVLLAIIRTKFGDERQLLPAKSNAKESFKALQLQLPSIFNSSKFFKIKDTERLLQKDLLSYESRLSSKGYKFGVLYVSQGQVDENDMFSNQRGSASFDYFLGLLGEKIELRNFKGNFRGGLDINFDTTGVHSVHTTFRESEIMYHVSTMLPYSSEDQQQLERKRHLGNDIVVIVFSDSNTPFPVDCIQSEFNHVYIVVRIDTAASKNGHPVYNINCAVKDTVKAEFGPILPKRCPAKYLKDVVLTKAINAERIALGSSVFRDKLNRTRAALLKDIVNTHCSKKDRAALEKDRRL
eukprot:TRINITY_DN5087_c0_g1_i1.p1 TRINITY_DN5087_c0_g1~~TRINITY_DN5087_c0_g1_i1.p1  ORF type:complete len:778 (-),score=119.83 TRINITY_DN5087_c0_g1_i1:1993-4326(-)